MTGSAIAIPLLGAASAHAADGTTWDKVAECESDGAWSADIGNGRYGGLQITQKNWEKYGGLEYAARADQASRSQQIAVAEKILADKGAGQWSTCGLLYGLDEDSGSAAVDTGVAGDASPGSSSDSSDSSDSAGSSDSSNASDSTGSSDSSDPSTSAGLSDSSTGNSSDSGAESSSPSDSASDKGKSGESNSSGSTGSSGSGSSGSSGSADSDASGSQSPGGSPTESTKRDDSGNSWQVGGASALVDTGSLTSGRHRGGSADEDSGGGLASDSTGRHAPQGDTYTVRVGDSLASIADSLDLDGGWHRLYAENKTVIGSDPSRITAGQTLEVGS